MLIIVGTVGLMMLVILYGKRRKEIRLVDYLIIGVIAVLQVAIVLFVMFTMDPPNLL